jgi:hypothetical protein
MHIAALAKRDAEAQAKILGYSERVVELLALPPALLEGLSPQQRDREVRAMLQREGVAEFLGVVVEALERGRAKGRPRRQEG